MTPAEKAQRDRDRAIVRDARACLRKLAKIFEIREIGAKMAEVERKAAQRYEDLPGRVKGFLWDAAGNTQYYVRDLIGRCTAKGVCRAREKVIWRCREAGYSLAEIGRMFGGRHHTTIMNALKNEERRRGVRA